MGDVYSLWFVNVSMAIYTYFKISRFSSFFISFPKSPMKTRNNKGPKTEPYNTPDIILLLLDGQIYILTKQNLPTRYSWSHYSRTLPISWSFIFFRSCVWSTVSYAFGNSRYTKSTFQPYANLSTIKSYIPSTCSSPNQFNILHVLGFPPINVLILVLYSIIEIILLSPSWTASSHCLHWNHSQF